VKRFGRGPGNLRSALIFSAVLHVGVISYFWVGASRGAPVEPMRVYAVNIVSPPPRTAGERAPERVAPEETQTPAATPEASPPPEPQPEPPAETPPTPEPQPAETPPQPQPQTPPPPAREPSRANATTTRTTPPPAQPERATQRQTPQPRRDEPARRPTPTPPREAEVAERTTPSSGEAPSPTSRGGENLAIRTQGMTCPSEEYCNNIVRQVTRYFRRPAQSRLDRADVCFRIARNGSVADIRVERLNGAFAFGVAASEAVEQAGMRNEFGPLPRAFSSDELPVCVAFTPET
jgi:outer membrane biosynthesis protein TonB